MCMRHNFIANPFSYMPSVSLKLFTICLDIKNITLCPSSEAQIFSWLNDLFPLSLQLLKEPFKLCACIKNKPFINFKNYVIL